jgi:hypothetical protein
MFSDRLGHCRRQLDVMTSSAFAFPTPSMGIFSTFAFSKSGPAPTLKKLKEQPVAEAIPILSQSNTLATTPGEGLLRIQAKSPPGLHEVTRHRRASPPSQLERQLRQTFTGWVESAKVRLPTSKDRDRSDSSQMDPDDLPFAPASSSLFRKIPTVISPAPFSPVSFSTASPIGSFGMSSSNRIVSNFDILQ